MPFDFKSLKLPQVISLMQQSHYKRLPAKKILPKIID